MKPLLSFAFLFSFTLSVLGETAPATAIDGSVQGFIERKEIAGAVLLVADESSVLHHSALGLADVETKRAMAKDDLFWIASMTKPITAVAVMMLVEEGKIGLEENVATYLPEFSKLKDAEGKAISLTVRHLLTHTSGLAGGKGGAAPATLEEMVASYPAEPLKFAPGSRWEYCNPGINTLGRIVEVVAKVPYEEFLNSRIFEPLGMKDTTFYPSEAQAKRIASSYETKEGALHPVAVRILDGKLPGDKSRPPMPAGGLFSTASDCARFYQMILRGGEVDGKVYLTKETVKEMTKPQTGDLKTGFTDGNAWGLGWCVVLEPQGVTAALRPGSFGHGGAYGTQGWVDPERKLIHVLLVQRSNFPNADASDLRGAFQGAVAESFKEKN